MTETVLVPMDGSEHSAQALEVAFETYPDATVIVLYVVDVSSPLIGERLPLTFDEEVQRKQEERGETIFEDARRLAEEVGFAGTLRERTGVGSPERSIVDHAEDADAIVMGSHGRDRAERVLLGSVAEQVVRQAPCPVTVVR